MLLNFDILLDAAAKQLYVVGGTIRDILLGRPPLDIDIAVSPDPESYARRLADKVSGRMVTLGKPGQALYRVVAPHQIYDVAGIQGISIYDDLQKRDFTINAIAYDVLEKRIIDAAGGQQDLANRTIRMVSEQSLQDDPVRLIRAFRIAAGLAFKMDLSTLEAIKRNVPRITQSAGERIRDELFKILSTPTSHDQLVSMADNEMLFYILPELSPLRDLVQHSRSDRTIFEHGLDAYSILEGYLRKPPGAFVDSALTLKSPGPTTSARLLKLSILLHHIGKAAKPPKCVGNRVRYHGYAHRGAALFESIAARLRLSNRDAAYIALIIRNQRKPSFLFKVHKKKRPNDRLHMVRFFLNLAPFVPDLLLHALADEQAQTGIRDPKDTAFDQFAQQLLDFYHNRIRPRINDTPLMNGNELINRFGLSPSPQFKFILRRIEELRLTGQLQTKADAEKWVQALLDSAAPSVNLPRGSRPS